MARKSRKRSQSRQASQPNTKQTAIESDMVAVLEDVETLEMDQQAEADAPDCKPKAKRRRSRKRKTSTAKTESATANGTGMNAGEPSSGAEPTKTRSARKRRNASKQRAQEELAETVEAKMDEAIEAVAECCEIDTTCTDIDDVVADGASNVGESDADEAFGTEEAFGNEEEAEEAGTEECVIADETFTETQQDVLDENLAREPLATVDCDEVDDATTSGSDDDEMSSIFAAFNEAVASEVAEVDEADEIADVTEVCNVIEPESRDSMRPSRTPDEFDEVVARVDGNTSLLSEIAEQLVLLREMVASTPVETTPVDTVAEFEELTYENEETESEDVTSYQNAQASAEAEELRREVELLREQLADADRQNENLTEQLNERVQVAAPVVRSEAMTWEQRKEMMLQQMEEDSFDAESFVADLGIPAESDEPIDPISYVTELNDELERCADQIRSRDEEIQELQAQLQDAQSHRPTASDDDTEGSDGMMDANELIREEREKLVEMQREWEARFRDSEIAASLERATISRERRELQLKNAELKEQLIHFRRESEENRKAGVSGSRRWLAKLGLHD